MNMYGHKFAVLLSCLFCLFLGACISLHGTPEIPRPDDARYDDAGIKTEILSALLKKDAAKANDINVHCFNGHVFLVGEADAGFRAEALDIAREAHGAVHVTTHWFPTGTASAARDALIEGQVAQKVLHTAEVNASRVALDVWGGNVVLTGTMPKQSQIARTIAETKKIETVKSVTSYLSVD
ncbi:BON domain-containing protein [Desulfovibrio sp. OttesenSCG-928-A18]|nr:BON domain-containing protein [Desulfovibrio sp. OttesenSCG-928-A18]